MITKIVRLADPQTPAAAATLARAFHEDPLMVYAIPDPAGRERLLPDVYMVRFGSLAGEVYATAGAPEGVALWLPPNAKWTRENIEASGMLRLAALIGNDACQHYREVVGREWQARERDMTGSCWYLFILGVEPSRQRRGLGGALIHPALERRRRAARLLSRDREPAQRSLLPETGLRHDRQRRRGWQQRRPLLDLSPRTKTLNARSNRRAWRWVAAIEMSGQILIVDPARNDILYTPVQTGLRERGHRVTRYSNFDQFLTDSAARETADVLFGLGLPFSRELLASMTRLRAVMSPVTGTEGIDERGATELGIIVGNGQIPENTESIAEATVMLILACLYDLHGSEAVMRKDLPHPNPVSARMAKGKLLGLIGFGQIARAISQRLVGWGVRIQTYTPRLRSPLPAHVERVELEQLLRTSDVVSVLCPLNDETQGMLSAERLGLLKSGAIFVNTARGKIVDEKALYELARSKHIRRIAIDVFEVEPPPPDSLLRQLPNNDAILTPHLVGHTAEVIEALPIATIESVERILAAEPPLYVRNPEVLPRWKQRWSGRT